ncbi:hypothetical protein chiPu_0008265 [Chiloscyllium punctatum]|uniref:Uncharacterized protein n=1 Tax=Chiloscyllium punctatum TaxID=137246 RepID=A0A401SHJ5_CHIPU|nr:hypothetical protein [Chiloscyllium punctatum]
MDAFSTVRSSAAPIAQREGEGAILAPRLQRQSSKMAGVLRGSAPHRRPIDTSRHRATPERPAGSTRPSGTLIGRFRGAAALRLAVRRCPSAPPGARFERGFEISKVKGYGRRLNWRWRKIFFRFGRAVRQVECEGEAVPARVKIGRFIKKKDKSFFKMKTYAQSKTAKSNLLVHGLEERRRGRGLVLIDGGVWKVIGAVSRQSEPRQPASVVEVGVVGR